MTELLPRTVSDGRREPERRILKENSRGFLPGWEESKR